MIEADGLVRRFGGRVAVDDVSFTVRGGEVVGFLGPNGAGKTTTMRLLLGLLRPDGGVATTTRPVGYLPERFVPYDGLSVERHLMFSARMKRVPRSRLAESVDEVVERCRLEELRRRPAGRLSKGQRQRLGLAQALLDRPESLVLDEPTSGLDPAQTVEARRIVRAAADRGAAVLLSTHLLAEAAAVCDRVVVIARGKVVAEERPGDAPDLEDRFLRLVGEAELQ